MRSGRRKFLGQGLGAMAGAAFGGLAFPSVSLAADTIKVGVLLDLSGPLQLFGAVKAQCLRLAAEEINANGGLLGRQLELVSYDTQSNNQLYGQYAQQLALRDRVAVVHGAVTSAAREVARPVLARAKTLYMMNMINEGTQGACDRNMFITGPTPRQLLDNLIPYMMEKHGKKMYVLAADYIFGQLSGQAAERICKEHGGEVVGFDLFPLDVDKFGPTISKIQSAKPDFVFNVFVGPAHGAFYGQWASAGMNKSIPMASHTIGDAGEQMRMPPEVSEGIVTVKNYYDELDTPASKEFIERFKKRFNDYSYVGSLGMADYQGMYLWAEAVRKANSVDREKVIEAFEAGIEIEGPSGKIASHPQTHYCTMDMYLAEVRDSRFQVLESWQQVPPVGEGDDSCNVLSMSL